MDAPNGWGAHMAKAVTRCAWAEGVSLDYIEYHDREWGVPVFDDRTQFEFLILEGAQAGLSWSTILNKREGYRKAFADFAVEKVARFTENRIEKLLQNWNVSTPPKAFPKRKGFQKPFAF